MSSPKAKALGDARARAQQACTCHVTLGSSTETRWECELRLRNPAGWPNQLGERVAVVDERADIGEIPAVQVIMTVALHLMSASAVACGLGDDEPDLAEARILITALAGLVNASAPDLGAVHAAPLRDGLKSLQLAFREASPIPDPPGMGPGETR